MKITTKKRIAQKFFEIAQKKNIDRITVQNIVNECHITRQSFYYHFQDIRAIIEWVLDDYVKTLLKNINSSTDIDEILKDFVESITEYSNVINAIMQSKERSQLEKLLKSVISQYIESIIEQKIYFRI